MDLRPSYRYPPGCLGICLAVVTLGSFPLLYLFVLRRRWIARLDERGLTLMKGTFVPWDQVRRVIHTTVNVDGTVVHHLRVETEAGKALLPYERLPPDRARRVEDFIARHAPPHALGGLSSRS